MKKVALWIWNLIKEITGANCVHISEAEMLKSLDRYYAKERRAEELERKAKKMMSNLQSDGHDNGTLKEGWNNGTSGI